MKAQIEATAKEADDLRKQVLAKQAEVDKLRSEIANQPTPSPKQVASKERTDRIGNAQKGIIQGILKKLGRTAMGIEVDIWPDIARLVRLEFDKGGVKWRDASEKVRQMLSGEGMDYDLDDIVDVSSGYAVSMQPKKGMDPQAQALYLARREEFLRSKLRDAKAGEFAPEKAKVPETPEIKKLKAELASLQSRRRMPDDEWNARRLADVQDEIANLENQLSTGNLEGRKKRESFRKASEELKAARKVRDAKRREVDARIEQAANPPGLIAKLKGIDRELQLSNPISAVKDVISNMANMTGGIAGRPLTYAFERLLGTMAGTDTADALRFGSPAKAAYILKDAAPRWKTEFKDALKGIDDVGGVRYDSTGPISRTRGALDTPFRDTYNRSMAYDLAASQHRPGTPSFDKAYQQILDPESGGPLSVEQARSFHEQAQEWASHNTYNNESFVSAAVDGWRKGGKQSISKLMGKTPEGRQAMKPVVESFDFLFDKLFRYTRVISNVAADAATYSNIYFALGRGVGNVASDISKYKTIRPVTIKRVSQMIAKGAVGLAVQELGKEMYERGISVEAITPVLVQTQTATPELDEETGKPKDPRKGIRYVDEGAMGGVGAALAPLTAGYVKAMLRDAELKGHLTPKMREKLEAEWTVPLKVLLNQPAVSGPQRLLTDIERTGGENWAKTTLESMAGAGIFAEWARLQDRMRTGVIRRDSKTTPAGKIKERIPGLREDLPVGQAMRFPERDGRRPEAEKKGTGRTAKPKVQKPVDPNSPWLRYQR